MSWWAVPFEGRIGVFFGISFLQCQTSPLRTSLAYGSSWLEAGRPEEDTLLGAGGREGQELCTLAEVSLPTQNPAGLKKETDKENIYTN